MNNHPSNPIIEDEFRQLLLKQPDEQTQALIEYLGTQNPHKVALAMHVLGAQGAPIVPMLIREALAPGRRPAHVVGILEIVAQIGEPLDVDQYFDLCTCAARLGKLVREKCREVFQRLLPARQGGSSR